LPRQENQPVSPGGNRLVELAIVADHETGPSLIWAQELFSIFMLAVASQVEEVLEVTEAKSQNGTVFENACFNKIAGFLVEAELVGDVEAALLLIIPAFLHCGLLRD
jgi:hypothetical protein